jgi:hypothetical protein
MKKFALFSCALVCFSMCCAEDWFDFAYKNIEYVTGFFKPHNEALFQSYKKQVTDLQDKITVLLKQAQSNGVLPDATKKTVDALQKQQNALLDKATNDLDSYDVTMLQQIVSNQQAVIVQLIDGWDYLYDFWEKNALGALKSAANLNNPFRNNVASVVQGDQLLPDEKDTFLKNRQATVQKGFTTFFNQQKNPIKLGYVAPGGGYRAMILTTGYLTALEETGLLDATSYLSALSGSTWFLIAWLFSNMSVRAFQNALVSKVKDKKFNVQTIAFDASGYIANDYLALLVADLWPKFLFNQSISSVDVYGSLLSRTLLSDLAKKSHLTDTWAQVKDGKKPFPLFSAVCVYNDNAGKQQYSWNEFTPLEVRNLEFKLSTPSYSFGSEFNAGKSKEIAPQQALGYLMGTFGSAYLLDLIDLEKIISGLKDQAAQKMGSEATQYIIAATLVNLINVLPTWVNNVRVSPSSTLNPYKNTTYANVPKSLTTSDQLMYVDAGISCNVPVLPLLRSSRQVQAIIIGDTSGDNPKDNEEPGELNKFFADAKRLYSYVYTRVDDKSTPTLRLYKDTQHPAAPRLIYVNFVKDDALLKKAKTNPALQKIIDDCKLATFDFNCINYQDGFCRFFNFEYTVEQFKQLAGIGEFNIKANVETIKAFLNKEFYSK